METGKTICSMDMEFILRVYCADMMDNGMKVRSRVEAKRFGQITLAMMVKYGMINEMGKGVTNGRMNRFIRVNGSII